MKHSRFVVCERTSDWAVALRWALADSRVRVYETRSWADCRQELADSPASLLALEMGQHNVADVGRWLVELGWCFPRSAAVVLTSRELSHCQWALREAGALHVVISRRDLSQVSRLVIRFLDVAAQTDRDFSSTLLDRLPWSDV